MAREKLSILNLERKTLPGPDYLHGLIDWSCTSVNAVEFWGLTGEVQQISYEVLDDLTSALAESISKALGATEIGHEDIIVPVLISQSLELYISWIATLKAGAAFCPIAIDSPAERVCFICQDVGASLVLTTTQHERWLAELVPNMEIVSVSQPNLRSTSKSEPSRGYKEPQKMIARPEALAYVMYTSGK